jgi:hypothetical protein
MNIVSGIIKSSKVRYWLAGIFVLALLGWLPVVMGWYTLKWDMTDQYFPWRYFTADCIRNGILPFWNPYQFLGYPIHADPQSGVFYPVVWIASVLGGYQSVISVSHEVVLHVIFGGMGMFWLARRFSCSHLASFSVAGSYMFCGYFTGNAQHLTWIISGAWVPFILASYHALLGERTWFYAIMTGFFSALLLTGGYPAFAIVLAYILITALIFKIINIIRKGKRTEIVKLGWLHLVAAFVVAAMSGGLLISVFQSLPHITRGESVTHGMAMVGPFSPQAMLSFILPIGVDKWPLFFNTPIGMGNAYPGIILLLLIAGVNFRKSPRQVLFMVIVGAVCLFASFGHYTPVRELMFNFLPGMGLFRFPSLFRLFVLIALYLVAAIVITRMQTDDEFPQKRLLVAGTMMSIILVIISFLHFKHSPFNGFYPFAFRDMNDFLSQSSYYASTTLQALVQLGFVIVFIILLFKTSRKIRMPAIILLAVFNSVVIFRMQMPGTVTSNVSVEVADHKLAAMPVRFPLPGNAYVHSYKDTMNEFYPFWKNLNVFYKKPAYDGFTPFHLKGYERFVESASFPDPIKHPVLYNRTAFLEKNKRNEKNERSADPVITKFEPGYVTADVSTPFSSDIVFIQNYYPGWEFRLNQIEQKLVVTSENFMQVSIPEGTHKLEYRYNPSFISGAFFLSVMSTVVFLLLLLWLRFRP